MTKKTKNLISYIFSVVVITIAVSIPFIYNYPYHEKELTNVKIDALELGVRNIKEKLLQLTTSKKSSFYINEIKEGKFSENNYWLKNYLQLSPSQNKKFLLIYNEYRGDIKVCQDSQQLWYWLHFLEKTRNVFTPVQNKIFYDLLFCP